MKRVKVLFILIIASSLGFGEPVEPSETSLKAAKELAVVLGLESQLSAGFEAMRPLIEQQAAQQQLSAEKKKELVGIYQTWFEEDLDHEKLSKAIIKMYAEAFSTEELIELTAFYQSALGQKTLLAMPELTAKGAQLGIQEGQEKQAILAARLEEFFAGKAEEEQ